MKRFVKAQLVFSFFVILGLSFQAQAGEFISMDPGESTIREFVLYDVLDFRTFRPIEAYLLFASGDNETKVGDLTITVKPSAVKEFGATLDYSLLGFAFPLGAGNKPAIISGNATAPLTLTKVVKMSTNYALVLVGTYIKDITGEVNRPVPFNITFSWAVGK